MILEIYAKISLNTKLINFSSGALSTEKNFNFPITKIQLLPDENLDGGRK